MKKIILFPIMITGLFFSLFIFNIILFALVPVYHDTLSEAVLGSSTIPTVIVDKKEDGSTEVHEIYYLNDETQNAPLSPTINIEDYSETLIGTTTDTAEKKPEIIDKTYHEDCGTGKGYWVIKYSDGSYEVE